MVSVAQLWLPIVLSAVLMFVVSTLVHMVFKWHNTDYRGLPNEDAVRSVIRSGNPAPGQYLIPYCKDPKEMKAPEMLQKFQEGPLGFLTLRKSGMPSMGAPLAQWFALNLIVAIAAGYLASRTLPFGAGFLTVCRLVGIVVFLAYAGGSISQAIWMGKPWGSAAKELLDSFLYGLASALAFAWLWPR